MNSEVIIAVLATVVILGVLLFIADRYVQKLAISSTDEKKIMTERIKELENQVRFLLSQLQSAQLKIASLQMELNAFILEKNGQPVPQKKNKKLNVLAVWSNSGGVYLDFTLEQRYIRDSNINLVALKGADATKPALVRELAKQSYDIIQLSAHGKDGAIVLNDGEVSPGWLGRAISGIAETLTCVVLLACQTSDPSVWNASDSLIDVGVPCVIGVSGDIDHNEATAFAGMLYELISRGHSVEHAFEQARLIVSVDTSDMLRLFRRK